MDMVQQVAAATEEQSRTSEQVSSSMERISGIISNNFTLTEEMDKSASEQTVFAQKVIEQIMYFKIDTNGNSVNQNLKHNSGYGVAEENIGEDI